MSSLMPSATIRARFWTKHTPDGKGGFKSTDMVAYAAVGKAHMAETVASVSGLSKLQPLEPGDGNLAIMMAHARWNAIKPQYDAWKQGREVPVNGTPLAAWPGVTSDQAELLRTMGLRTVEEIADASESITSRIPFPGARQLPALAADFLKAADKTKVASELSDMRETLRQRDEALEEMRQIVLEMQAKQNEAAAEKPAPKAKGGRKADADEQAAA